MSDSFLVNHGGYDEANDGLRMQLNQIDTIIGDVKATLNRIGIASQGKATPIWEAQAAQWQNAILDMHRLLGDHTTSSFNVHETFRDGDNHGARIMS
jgi:hypothetical protein